MHDHNYYSEHTTALHLFVISFLVCVDSCYLSMQSLVISLTKSSWLPGCGCTVAD